MLDGYIISFSGREDSAIDASTSREFFDHVESSVVGLCRGPLPGEPALVAKSDVGVIRVVNTGFTDIHNVSLEASCSNSLAGCPHNRSAEVSNDIYPGTPLYQKPYHYYL